MAINYYYFDDDPKPTISETAKGLSIFEDRLKVNAFQHEKWDDQVSFIIEQQDSFDGLILDWSLNNKNQKGDIANYNVEALAQQLRRLIIENDRLKKDFPIVLCSANYRFNEVFCKEVTGHDLFDAIYEKDQFDSEQSVVINQLEDLANGYKIISLEKAIERLLNTTAKEDIDYRIIDFFENNKEAPTHELARFLLNSVIKPTGILIDEYLLASRLGIDIISGRNKDWTSLLEIIDSTKYSGVFSKGWNRWWMSKLDVFWEKTFEKSLGSLNGNERVMLLNERFNLNLDSYKVSKDDKNSFFWVKCKKTNRPLALEDAVLATSD